MEIPGYYAIIPSNVRYHKSLNANAKLLYGEITALSNKEGFCWASNEYFAELYEVSLRSISRWISDLKEAGFIDVFLDENSSKKRKISIAQPTTKLSIPTTKLSIPHDKIVLGTIYSINNTINTAGSALNYVIENLPIRFEQEFLMPFEKQFKSQNQFDMFLRDFNDEAEMKQKAFDGWLIPMMKKYCRKWLDFQGRMKVVKNDDQQTTQKGYLNAAI